MTDQNTFMEMVHNVAEIVRTAPVPMTEEEILVYFADMDLDESKKKLVLEYILSAESRKLEEEQRADEESQQAVEQEISSENEEPNSKVFQMYLEELSMLPSFSGAERQELYEKLSVGDSCVIETISTAWLKKVLTIAEKYIEPNINVEDLVQEGNMALFMKLQELLGCGSAEGMEEVLRLAVEEGIMTYCAMLEGEREQESTLLGKVSLVQEAKKILEIEKGQDSTLEELADYTKMSVEELQDLEEFLKG